MDNCGSSSSSSQEHPMMSAWSHARGSRHAVDVCSTLDRFLPSSVPPPLLPLAGTRRAVSRSGNLKLERVPTPTRADQLLVDPRDKHDVTVCFPRQSRSRFTATRDVQLVMMSNNFIASDIQADNPPYAYRQNPIDARILTREVVPMSGVWAPAVSGESSDEWQVLDGTTGQPSRPHELDEKCLTQTADDFQPSTTHRSLPPPPSRCGWTTATQHRGVHFDNKYWERRRKNNEAAKRSRDIRRANERRVALRATLLERENARLRSEVQLLTENTLRLHYYLLCSRTIGCSHCSQHASE